MIERCLRVVEGTLQCDVVHFQLADLLVLVRKVFQSVMDFGDVFDSSTPLRNIVVSSDRDCVSS